MRFLTGSFARLSMLAALTGLAACTPDAPTAAPTTVHLAVVGGGHHGGRPFSTAMTQEVTSQPVWNGDPDGVGDALISVNRGQREICWELEVSAISLPATAAHIHEAAPGIRGPIVVSLSPPNASGAARGCASGLNDELLQKILRSPEAFYVNVHTTDFPAGAVRGQLDE
jgi:hypothetical protein